MSLRASSPLPRSSRSASPALAIDAGDDGGGGERYLVRAIFDNSSFVIPGEDVKVAGVKVGKIDSLDLTRDNKAVVVLELTDPASSPQDRRPLPHRAAIADRRAVRSTCRPRRRQRRPRKGASRRSRTARARASTCCRCPRTPRPSASISSATSCAFRARPLKIIINELGATWRPTASACGGRPPCQPRASSRSTGWSRSSRARTRCSASSPTTSTARRPAGRNGEGPRRLHRHRRSTAVATAKQGDALEQNFAELPAPAGAQARRTALRGARRSDDACHREPLGPSACGQPVDQATSAVLAVVPASDRKHAR